MAQMAEDIIEVEAADRITADRIRAARIAAAAEMGKDITEVEAADRIRDGIEKSRRFFHDLQKIIQDMDCIIKEEVIKVKEERRFEDEQHTSYMAPPSSLSSAPTAIAKTSTMMGFQGYLEQVLDELTGYHSGRRVLPIVGMGGIGKTTLARNAYEHLLTVHHFDVRVWVTVSQAFSVRDILSQALSCLGGCTGGIYTSDDEVGEELYKILSGRRYLVVLDDVWSVEAWEKIKFFIPENCNRSRIVVTTRQQQLVDYFASSGLALDFLDDQNSWDLFCDKAFAQQGCPPQLQEIGRKIVKKCKGLPLAIIVIGGLLGKSPRTQEYWEKILKDKSLVLDYSGEGNKPLSILYLSYKHLPVCLKSCFLHLGLYPEDHQIHVSQLIKFWVAEGFIKPSINQSLEEVAESYIKDLVDRNLVLRLSKKFGTCCLHDLVRDLCIRIAEKERFYCVQRDIDGRRHFIVDERTASYYSRDFLTCETASVMRPLVFHGQREAPFKSRLLRVLVGDIRRRDPTFQQVNLRFLFQNYTSSSDAVYLRTLKLPPSISLCWSLQTLIFEVSCSVVLPSEIWKMRQLRHIEMQSMYLPDPPPDDAFVLQNLQTLKRANNLNFSEEVCKRIPNVKELEIYYNFGNEGGTRRCLNLHNVRCLNKLETLRYSCTGKEYVSDLLQYPKLPSSLKELGLWGCCLVQSDTARMASLPHLERLELCGKAVVGAEWNCIEEEFKCLKHLRIDYCDDLISWIAHSSNFPVLETLTLRSLPNLGEIPSGIGEIPTLEKLFLYKCSESVTMSAIKILEEQENLGNQHLHLQLQFFDRSEAKRWKIQIPELGFACQNLHISWKFRLETLQDFDERI